jgi:hypothetical protein
MYINSYAEKSLKAQRSFFMMRLEPGDDKAPKSLKCLACDRIVGDGSAPGDDAPMKKSNAPA